MKYRVKTRHGESIVDEPDQERHPIQRAQWDRLISEGKLEIIAEVAPDGTESPVKKPAAKKPAASAKGAVADSTGAPAE